MTKKQRHKVYKKALVHYNKSIKYLLEYDIAKGLCECIAKAANTHYTNIYFSNYEEFKMFEPDIHGIFWFDKHDTLTRQIILDFCILMTKTK